MQSIDVFSQKNLKAALDAALPVDLKPGENVVVAAVDEDGFEVVAAYRLTRDGVHVEVQGAVRHEFTGGASGAGRVLVRW